MPRTALQQLTDINLDDFFDALGLPARRGSALRWLFWLPARRFAQRVLEFDRRVGVDGLAAGSAWLLQQMTGGLAVAGHDHIPTTGPLLILANHPGMADTLALFASLRARPDLRVIAATRPFLQVLPHVNAHMLYVQPDRMSVVRATVNHLRQGGAVLTFPAGDIEPDPALVGPAEAVASLARWADSLTLFARRVPQTRLIPAIVSQVIASGAQRHPLTRLRATRAERDQLAAALQVLLPAYQHTTAHVAFGPPLLAADLMLVHRDAASLTRALTTRAQQLLEQPPTEWETLVTR